MKGFGMVSVAAAACLAVGCMSYEKRLEQCDAVGEFKDGHALCRQDGKYFFIDSNGKRVSGRYDQADEYANGYAVVQQTLPGGECQIILLDKDCREKNYGPGDYRGQVNRWGKLWVNVPGGMYGWAMLDVETGALTPVLGYPDCLTEDGHAVVSRRNDGARGSQSHYEYAIYDGQGNASVPFGTYTFIGNLSNGLAQFSTTGYFPYSSDHAMSSDNYDQAKRTCRSLATADNSPSPDIRLGYIDPDGKVIIPERYNTATMFNRAGYACVGTGHRDWNRRTYVIDRNGRDCTGQVMAEASLLPDREWIAGKKEDGECVVANNRGMAFSLGTGCDIASTRGLTMTRKGSEYNLYKVNKAEDDLELLATFRRSAGDEIVVVHSIHKRGERTPTHYIRFFDRHAKRGWGNGENYFEEYLTDGTLNESGWDAMYRAGYDRTMRFPAFEFK